MTAVVSLQAPDEHLAWSLAGVVAPFGRGRVRMNDLAPFVDVQLHSPESVGSLLHELQNWLERNSVGSLVVFIGGRAYTLGCRR
jgi:hypothetical protein